MVFSISDTLYSTPLTHVLKIGISSYANGPGPADQGADGKFPDVIVANRRAYDPYYVSSYLASIGGQEGTWLFHWSAEINYGLPPLRSATNATI